MVRLMVQDLLLLLPVVDLNSPPPVFDNDMVRLMAQRGLLVVQRPLPSTLGSSNAMARLQVGLPLVDLNHSHEDYMECLMAQRRLLVVQRPLPSTLGSSNGMARLQVVPPLVDLDHSHGDYPSAPNHHFVNSSIMATLVILLVLVMIVHELQVQWQNEFLL